MDETERLNMLKSTLEKGFEKSRSGESSFVIITEKGSNKYLQISMISGENEIVIDVPEGVFEPDELERISQYLKEAEVKHKAAVGLTIWVSDVEEAIKLINEIFKRGLKVSDNYDIEIETTY